MKRSTLFYEGIHLLYTLLNIIMYLANAASYMLFTRYKDTTIPYKSAFAIFLLMLAEIAAFVLLSGAVTKDGTPFQKLYCRRLRIAFGCSLPLIALRFVTLRLHSPAGTYAYMTVWGLLGILSACLYLSAFRSCSALVKHKPETCRKLLDEYALVLSADELAVMKQIKRSMLYLSGLFLLSEMFMEQLCSGGIVVFAGFSIVYMAAVYMTLIPVFRYYAEKRAPLLSVLLALCAGLGCLAVWLISQKIITSPILTDRTPEEIAIFLLLFLLPALILLGAKYRRYQRHRINERADSFMRKS